MLIVTCCCQPPTPSVSNTQTCFKPRQSQSTNTTAPQTSVPKLVLKHLLRSETVSEVYRHASVNHFSLVIKSTSASWSADALLDAGWLFVEIMHRNRMGWLLTLYAPNEPDIVGAITQTIIRSNHGDLWKCGDVGATRASTEGTQKPALGMTWVCREGEEKRYRE